MIILLHKDFKKKFKKNNIKIQKQFLKRIEIFKKNQNNPILNNHKLTGKFKDKRSINVTGDIRAIFIKDGDKMIFVFLNLGTHSEIYK